MLQSDMTDDIALLRGGILAQLAAIRSDVKMSSDVWGDHALSAHRVSALKTAEEASILDVASLNLLLFVLR